MYLSVPLNIYSNKVVAILIMSISRSTLHENENLSTKLNEVYSKVNSRWSSSVTAG